MSVDSSAGRNQVSAQWAPFSLLFPNCIPKERGTAGRKIKGLTSHRVTPPDFRSTPHPWPKRWFPALRLDDADFHQPSCQPDPRLLEPLSTSEASHIWGFSVCEATPQACSFLLSRAGREPSFLDVMMVHDSWEPRSLVLLSNQQVHSCVPRPSKLHRSPAFQAGNIPTNSLVPSVCVVCVNVCVNAQRKLKAKTWKKARSLRLVISSKPSCP